MESREIAQSWAGTVTTGQLGADHRDDVGVPEALEMGIRERSGIGERVLQPEFRGTSGWRVDTEWMAKGTGP